MKRPPRPVVLADLRGATVALQAVANGNGLCAEDVRALCVSAGIKPRTTIRATFITRRELPDLEALAEHRGWVVVRRSS